MLHIFRQGSRRIDRMKVDPYLIPAYSRSGRARRMLWSIAWTLLYRTSPRPFFAWRAFLLRCFGAQIKRPSFFYPKATVWAPWLLRADAIVTVADGAEIYNPGGIEIGDHVIISQGAFICGASHDFNLPDFPMESKAIVLKSHAWVCARAIVLPGVTLEEGAVLGAGAVTSRNLGRLTINAGNPSKVVGMRDPAALSKGPPC
jgi:putative colanic acid biosynthesis acetyltransferase WcaF